MKYLLTFFILIVLSVRISAQVYLVRKKSYTKVSSCSLLRDSTVAIRIDNQYNTGRQLNCSDYYTYDDKGRITSLLSNCETGKTWFYYYPHNQTHCADSMVSIIGGIARISAFDYDTDSIITGSRMYYTDKGFPELGYNVRYTKQEDGRRLILTSRDMLSDTSLDRGYNRVTFENGIEKLTQSKTTSQNKDYIVYAESFETKNSDTIIFHRFDSTVSKTDPQDIYSMVVKRDSFVAIRSHYTGFDVVTSMKKVFGVFNGQPQLIQDWKSIDTFYANGSSIKYTINTQGASYDPVSKIIVRKGGNEMVSYQYKEKKWVPTQKEERYFTDAERNCEGLFFYYIWVNNQWVLDIQSAYYYQGQTAYRPKPESVPCKIVNPFSANYPVSCDALIPEEKYLFTLRDLDGQLVFAQEFKADQQIMGLDELKKDRLYFLTIQTESGTTVTHQKIFLSY